MHRPLVELQLVQPQRQVAVAVTLVEHHLLGVHRPPLRERPGPQHLPNQRRAAVRVRELHVVPRVRLVDGEDLQHRRVVFAEEGLDARRGPVGRRRGDRVEAVGLRVERRGRVQVRRREPALELGHLDDLARVRLRQREDLLVADEVLDLVHGLAGVGDEVLRLAVVLAELVQDRLDRGAAAVCVVRRDAACPGTTSTRVAWRRTTSRARRDRPRPRRASRPRRRVRPGVEFQFQLLGELLLAEPPLAVRFRQKFRFEPRLVVLERLDGGLARRRERLAAGRLPAKV